MPPEFPEVSDLAAPIYVAFILFELTMIAIGRARGLYETRDTATSLAMGLGSVVSGVVFGGAATAILLWVWHARLFTLEVNVLTLVAAFVLDDFRYYWWHRIAHRCRWFWADHVIHHSSQHMNLSTALRQPWTGLFTGAIVFRFPLVLLGFHPAVLAFVGGLNLIYQFFVHTEAVRRMPPWFEAVMNTPSHHRVHHARNAAYLDANYAGVFIVWDRLFGTFVPEDDADPCRYGLVKNITTFNPLRVAFHEWVGIFRDVTRPRLSLGQRLAYMFAPPGWSHDGSRQTTQTLKKRFAELHPEQAHRPGIASRVKRRRTADYAAPAE